MKLSLMPNRSLLLFAFLLLGATLGNAAKFTKVPLDDYDFERLRGWDLVLTEFAIEKFQITFDRSNWVKIAKKGLGSRDEMVLPNQASKVTFLLLNPKDGPAPRTAYFVLYEKGSSVSSYLSFNSDQAPTLKATLTNSRFTVLAQLSSQLGSNNFVYRFEVEQTTNPPKVQ